MVDSLIAEQAGEVVRGGTSRPIQVIEPRRGSVSIDWREIWRYRELLYFLTWRDVKVR